jgi:hypothetical protein
MPSIQTTRTPRALKPTAERGRLSLLREGPAISTEQGPARAGARLWRAISTLERLRRDDVISARQAEAGEKLRQDWEIGVIGVRLELGSGGSIGWYYPDVRLVTLKRWKAAVEALGSRLARYVEPVVYGRPGGGDISLSDLARRLGENRQGVAACVRLGLDVLADHYGLGPC